MGTCQHTSHFSNTVPTRSLPVRQVLWAPASTSDNSAKLSPPNNCLLERWPSCCGGYGVVGTCQHIMHIIESAVTRSLHVWEAAVVLSTYEATGLATQHCHLDVSRKDLCTVPAQHETRKLHCNPLLSLTCICWPCCACSECEGV